MYEMLAMYEAELARMQQLVGQLEAAQDSVDKLKPTARDTILVDGKAYKEGEIDSASGSLGGAIGYINGTVIPILQTRIDELREEIRRYEEEQRRLAEEAERNAQNS